jgi:radical SAM protein with 4Fe4S-binding SPASM domain
MRVKMAIDLNGVFYTPDFVQLEQDGVFLLIDPGSPNWVSTSRVGAQILRRCDGRHTLAELGAGLSPRGDWDEGTLTNFLVDAAEAGFVSNNPDVVPPYRGRGSAISPGRLEEVWVYTNDSCHLRCRHCLVSAGEMVAKQPSLMQIRETIDQALALGASRIYLTGGEPFLRKDILSIIEYGVNRCQTVVLTTGTRFDDDVISRLAKLDNGNLLLQISLEGPDVATHDAIKGRGNFDRSLAAIKRLVGAGIDPIVSTTLTSLNQERVGDITRLLATLGVADHHIIWLHGRGRLRQHLDELLVPGESVAGVMNELASVSQETGVVVDNDESLRVRVRGARGHKNDLCNCAYSMLSVASDGTVYPCAALSGEPQFAAGSIREQTLGEVWRGSSVLQWVRDNSVQKRVGCSSCYLKFFCGGGCFAQSFFDHEISTGEGCIMAPDPYCEAYKSRLLDIMWELARAGIDAPRDGPPRIFNTMETELAACAVSDNEVLDGAFDVGTYHCSCVLAMDVEGGA